MADKRLDQCNPIIEILISRLKNEYTSYINVLSKDDQHAMMCHPFMAYQGLLVLEKNTGMLDQEKHAALKEDFITFVSTFIKSAPSSDDIVPMNESTSTSSFDEGSNLENDDFFSIRNIPGEETPQASTTGNSIIATARSEVTKYIHYCTTMDWEDTITNHQTNVYKTEYETAVRGGSGDEWMKNFKNAVKALNIVKIWQYFDLLSWWTVNGKVAFPHVAMAAAVTLARPYTNASQERDFSMATWFDGNLVQQQKPEILERRLLLGLNREVLNVMKSEILIMQKINLPEPQTISQTNDNDNAIVNMEEPIETVDDVVANEDFPDGIEDVESNV